MLINTELKLEKNKYVNWLNATQVSVVKDKNMHLTSDIDEILNIFTGFVSWDITVWNK